MSERDSREEALRNIQEAMEGWVEVAHERGFGALVEETPELVAAEIAEVLNDRAEEGGLSLSRRRSSSQTS